ncbi:MAG: N-acetylmuramoyl-L-alanine amidase, partial [Clostridia bacterium]|nr:N-acetylmuramoyl-L-alanine amidase [Clostridia bacterium]
MSNKTRKLTAVILAFITCFSVLTFSPFNLKAEASGETFIIDVGHGGEDPGALGPNGREEADDVLNLALRVGEILEPYTTFVFTRTTDKTLSLSQRSSMANAGGYDYIISIHRNAFSNTAAKGLEVWWYSGTYGGNPSACEKFATSVYDSVMEQVPVWTERGVKDGNLHMCRQPYMPSCLIETGFITNTQDNQIFDQYFEQNAIGIANGMLKMIGKSVNSSAIVSTTHKLDGNSYVDMGKDFYARVEHPASGKYLADVNGEVCATEFSGGSEQVWHFMRQASGAYLVGNGATAKFWDVSGSKYDNGTPIISTNVTFEANQKFYIYYINNAFHFMPEGADKTFDIDATSLKAQVYGSSVANASDVAKPARTFDLEILNVYDGTRTPSNLGDTFTATIKNSASSKFLTASGSSLIGANESKADNQKWNFTRLPNGAYTIVSQSENLSIDVYETRIAEGTTVDLHELHGGNAQNFFLIEVDGTYYIKPAYSLNALYMNSSSLEFFTYETGEDSAKIAAQKFEIIIGGSESELILKDSSKYSKDGTDLLGVASGQTVLGLIGNFDNTNVVVRNANGTELSPTDKVGTGCEVVLIVNGEKVDALTVVVKGDVTGEGAVDGTDYLRIKAIFLGTYKATGAFLSAADVDETDAI